MDPALYDEMLKLVFLIPGIPCIYYGTEQYLHNKSYKYNRSSFGQIGADPWNRDYMNWNIKNYKNKKAYSLINKLSELKKKNNALIKGKLKLINTDEKTLAFERAYKKDKILYVSSIKEEADNIQIKTNLKNGIYVDPLSSKKYKVSKNTLSLNLEPFSSVVLISSE